MILVPGTAIGIPASEIAHRQTSSQKAWLKGRFVTVQLHGPLRALRVHVDAGEGATSVDNVHLVAGASLHGKWFAIGDFIQSYTDYIQSRALPKTPTKFGPRSMFTEAALVTFRSGVVLNVGRAGPLFGHRGGGEQAEYLDGPAPTVEPIHGVWGNEYGHA